MLIRTGVVWFLERAAELVAGALIALAISGPSNFPVGDTTLGQLRIGLAVVSVFYVASGYIVSGVAFGLFVSRQRPVLHGALMGGLFFAHSLFFFLYVTGGSPIQVAPIVSGVAAVFLINTAGTAILRASRRRYEG